MSMFCKKLLTRWVIGYESPVIVIVSITIITSLLYYNFGKFANYSRYVGIWRKTDDIVIVVTKIIMNTNVLNAMALSRRLANYQ